MKAPAFQFYPRDFLVGVTGLTNEETGVFIKLLCLQWERGALPSDQISLKKLVGSNRALSQAVLSKFIVGPDNLMVNERLEKIRTEHQSYCDKQKANSKKRWNKPASSQTDPIAIPPHPSGTSQTDALQSADCNSTHTHPARIGHNDSELPTESQAIALGANAGIPESFSKLVYSEWFERQGNYRDGPVPFIRRLMGRWTRERAQWETAGGGDILGAAAITKEVMEKGIIGSQRKQERYQNLKNFGDGLIMPSQRPQIATIQSGRAQVPTGLPQYQQFGGSGPGASMGGGGGAGMQYFNSSMTPQSDPLGQYNARVAAQQANAKPNPWATIGSQTAAGASFGSMFGPYGTAIGGAAGAGLGAIQAFACRQAWPCAPPLHAGTGGDAACPESSCASADAS